MMLSLFYKTLVRSHVEYCASACQSVQIMDTSPTAHVAYNRSNNSRTAILTAAVSLVITLLLLYVYN